MIEKGRTRVLPFLCICMTYCFTDSIMLYYSQTRCIYVSCSRTSDIPASLDAKLPPNLTSQFVTSEIHSPRIRKERKMKSIEEPLYDIKGLIYVVRNQQVMLDSDLAMLYHVETGALNQAVKRNVQRFPERFRFQLTEDEYANLISQIVISSLENNDRHGGRRKLPYVFTEQGIAMLAALLRSDIAILTSINIMDTFVEMRKFIGNNALLFDRLNNVELEQREYQTHTNERFEQIFNYISDKKESSQKIFFDGQIYDAFGLLIKLIQKANDKIILIDGYVDIGTLNLLSKKNERVVTTVYTHRKTNLNELDINNFNVQYPFLEVKYTESFHDRFLIIDDKQAYHIGASLKDAGKKCFAINLIEDSRIVSEILKRLKDHK